MTTLLVVGIVALALLGAPIFACMAAFAVLGERLRNPSMLLEQAFTVGVAHVQEALAGPNAATLATLPLFVFMGYVMAESKTAERLVRCAQGWLGWFPGGLAIVTICACAFFTTVTGASGVTIVAIGGLLLPSLLKERYGERFSLGLVTGTGSIGLLFPPALPLIVYGIVYGIAAQGASDSGESSAMKLADFEIQTFLSAGIFPGLLLVATVGAYAVVVAVRHKVPRTPFAAKNLAGSTLRALPELVLPILLIVPIVTGKLQIPEAAAFAAMYVLVIEVLAFRDVRVRALPKIAREAMTLVGAIFIIIVAATALTQYFIDAGVTDTLYAWMGQYITSKWTFLLALNLLLLVVGCLMDIFSAIVVVVPLIVPAAKIYGIDPYHLGVIFLLNLEIGYLTPPVGLNLFITSFRFRKPMVDVYKAAMPFMGVMLVALMMVTYIPLLVPESTKLLRLFEQKHATADMSEAAAPAAAAKDAGPGAVRIEWSDGGVWTIERCEKVKEEDPIAYAECKSMFALWPKCAAVPDSLERLECQQKVLDNEDPFATDAAPETDEKDAGAL